MMQTVPKWKVTVEFSNYEKNVTFWVYDNHSSNVLRHIASMDFSGDGLTQPTQIVVTAERVRE